MALNTAQLFDQPEYADVVVKYSDRKTFCHKIILCTSSEYFKKLCGPRSQFAESKQDTIELKEDDPDAVFYLLRYIYTGISHCEERENDYALQLEISKVAQKYLYPELHDIASDKFRDLFNGLDEPAKIFDAITHVRGVSDDEYAVKLANDAEERHILALLKVPGFRDRIDQDKEEMWKHLDEYRDFKAGLEEMKVVWCTFCGDGRLYTAAAEQRLPKQHPSSYTGRHESISCWIPKEGRPLEFATASNKSFQHGW